MAALPDDASLTVARIDAMLDEADRLIVQRGIGDDESFSLRETRRRYLPDTLDAYEKIPPSGRDAVAQTLLIEQLRILERATAQRLAALADTSRAALAANGTFLAERFADDALVPTPDVSVRVATPADGSAPPSRTLVARFFSDLEGTARGADPAALVARAGERFATVFPALTTVRRGLFGGPVKAVILDVPRGADVLRYSLETDRGGVAAQCTKIVRGVALRTERIDFGEWLHALFDDLGAYVERDRTAREMLTTFLAS